MEVVRREHDEIVRASRSVEGRLIQVESELMRAVRVKKEAEEERDVLKSRAEMSEKLVRTLNEKVVDYQGKIRLLKKDLMEIEELGKVRSDRTLRIESELQDARATLLEATSAASEAESTVTSLRSVIEELRKENESLHLQMNDSRVTISIDKEKQNESLMAVEKEVQKWKMKCEQEEEEIRKLKMDKTSAEKQLDQLKSRIASLERRLNDESKETSLLGISQSGLSAATPSVFDLGLINSFGAKEVSIDTDASHQHKYVSKLPLRESMIAHFDSSSRHLTFSSSNSLYSAEKENSSNINVQHIYGGTKRKVVKSNRCCLCLQDASGLMKSCQCNKINCDKRAHAACILNNKTSSNVSITTILCDGE